MTNHSKYTAAQAAAIIGSRLEQAQQRYSESLQMEMDMIIEHWTRQGWFKKTTPNTPPTKRAKARKERKRLKKHNKRR